MAKKKTQEQFEKEVHEKYPQIQIRGKYNGSNERVNVYCNIDEYDWDALPSNLLAYGCPVCNGSIITTNSFRNEISKLYPDIEILGEWDGARTPIQCHCKKCDYKWAYRPRSIKEHGCPKCNNSPTRKKTDEEYQKEIFDLFNGTVEVVENYVSMNTKILHKCLIHNVNYKMQPSHALRGQQCPYCANEKRILKTTKPLDIFLSELNKTKGSEYEYISGYVNSNTNAIFRHHMNDGNYHDFKMTPNSILSGYNCPCCSGYQVSIGFNDFNTKHPEYINWLENINEGLTHTASSGDVTNWTCPHCHHKMKKSFALVHTNGITCPCCDDGYSYPNKFMFNLLLQIKDNFNFLDREYRPDWCTFQINNKECYGRYDIYFILHNKKYIVEMDGGLGHGNRIRSDSNVTQDESLLRDKIKDDLATQHGIQVIRIDCNYETHDRFEYIKNNICNSMLSKIIDISILDFDSANIKSLESMLVKSVTYWNNNMTIAEIANELSVHECTVTNYLKKAKKYGICDSYSAKESKYRAMSNAVVCITTGKHFRSIADGANYYNITATDISKCCRRTITFGGWYNGQKLIWMYEKDYNKYPKDKLSEYVPKENEAVTKVVCLNTGEVFEQIKFAAQKYNMKSTSGIVSCCTGKFASSGKDENNIPLKWRYYSDYINMSEDEIQDILNTNYIGWKKVICLDTMEVFDNATLASQWCNVENRLPIQACCRGEIEFSGFHPQTNIPLHWKYYKDYLKEVA